MRHHTIWKAKYSDDYNSNCLWFEICIKEACNKTYLCNDLLDMCNAKAIASNLTISIKNRALSYKLPEHNKTNMQNLWWRVLKYFVFLLCFQWNQPYLHHRIFMKLDMRYMFYISVDEIVLYRCIIIFLLWYVFI